MSESLDMTVRRNPKWATEEIERLRQELAAARSGCGTLLPDVDWLANVIRTNDGNHAAGCSGIGAGALAEKIVEAMRGTMKGTVVQSATPRSYDVAADAVEFVADVAAEAFRNAGLEPGEWDGDNIVKDVASGIANDIERMGRLRAGAEAELAGVRSTSGTNDDLLAQAARCMEFGYTSSDHKARLLSAIKTALSASGALPK